MTVESMGAASAGARIRPSRVGRRRAPLMVLASGGFLTLVVVLAVFGGLIAPRDPNVENLQIGLTGPTGQFWLGTDTLGRDVFSNLILGARSALIGPLLVAIGAMVLGNVLGTIAGYYGGLVDAVISRVTDVMYALPGLVVALVLVGVLGGGYYLAVGFLVFLFMPFDTRIVRAATLEQRPRPYVESARTLGIPSRRIIYFHIWPNITPIVLSNTFVEFAFAIVTLSSLSFLGLGAGPQTPDWGRMLADSRDLIFGNPLAALAPGLMLALTAASLYLVGDWLYGRLTKSGDMR